MPKYKHIDIDLLEELTYNNYELVSDLVDMFIEQLPTYSTQLDELFSKKEYLALGKLAHKIKGSISTLAIVDLASEMKEFEMLAKGGVDESRYPVFINNFKVKSSEAITELKDILNRI